MEKIKGSYLDAVKSNVKFKVLNPVNPQEDFTDSWTDEHFNSFYAFISDLYIQCQNLKTSFETGKDDYIKLFGEGVYKKSLNEQIVTFSKNTDDGFANASALIIGGKAYTNTQGQINPNTGIKNESHHNFGSWFDSKKQVELVCFFNYPKGNSWAAF